MKEQDKLDRSRHYGTVYGDPNVGFFQDERPYRHDGKPYVAAPPPSVPAAPVAPVSDERRAAQSAAMKKIWAEKREARAKAFAEEPTTNAEV